MIAAVAIVLAVVVAGYVAFPLLRAGEAPAAEKSPGERERWAREKAVAVLAISEADFDLATGKLSDADYQVLRSDYEGRALEAMDQMEQVRPAAGAPVTGLANYCASCGNAFGPGDSFCGGCGRPRAAA